jgi:hypothetical protein
MNVNQCAGWTLVLSAIVLLVILGKFDLLVILIPLSLVVAFGVGCSGQHKTRLTSDIEKG